MTRQHKNGWHNLRKGSVSASDLDNLMNILLALDRSVVELSMHVYQVPPGHRLAMREQNRRLHEAVRKRLPRSLSNRTMGNRQEAPR